MLTSNQRRSLPWLVLKLAIIGLVVWGICRSVDNAWDELTRQPFKITEMRVSWLALAAALYAAGLFPMAIFWNRLLVAMGQHPGMYESIRAHVIGHLGKYVPGKFMVILLRTGLIQGQRVDAAAATISVFAETLTMMASGAGLAAIILLVGFRDQYLLQWLAGGLMLATVFATLPPILRQIVKRLLTRNRGASTDLEHAAAEITWGLIAQGWAWNLLAWCMLACSLWATIQAIPGIPQVALSPSLFGRLIASTALAVVAGFLSLIPGGLFVREWVLDQLMSPIYGAAPALIVPVVLRCVWLLTELVLSIILYVIPPAVTHAVAEPVSTSR